MRKLFILLLFMLLIGPKAFASDIEEVKAFFDSYVKTANSYDRCQFGYYTSNPVVIRIVEKHDGTTESVTVPFATYKRECKLGAKIGRIRKYRNSYSNLTIVPEGNDYKLSAMRKPSTSDYSLPAYFIIGKDSSGEWKIKKEVMHTKVQTFLKRKHSGG